MMCGGVGNFHPADDHLTNEFITSAVLDDIKAKLHATQVAFKEYATQVVAGTNCHVKGTADGKSFEAVIFKPLPYTNQGPSVSRAEFTA
jgi:hypothetical protein